MQEDYLHYLWEFQKWNKKALLSSNGVPVTVLSPGTHNLLSGPDFFNARLVLGEQQWAGNVEIHLKSSDWYHHSHEKDPAYDNVVLHVVWEHDIDVYRKDNSVLPVLELKNNIAETAIDNYRNLLLSSSRRWINCETSFPALEDFQMHNWLERLFFERLERKAELIFENLERAAGDWEAVLFTMLARSFGLNTNGEAFYSIACSIPFTVIRKCRKKENELQALFLGQAGLLEKDCQEPYFESLRSDYLFLKHKFSLSREGVMPVRYFRLRPDNFPEIRLVQLAAVYHRQAGLFNKMMHVKDASDLKNLFLVELNEFWRTHYTFNKEHAARKKQLTSGFLNLILINTLVPVKFCFLKDQGKEENERLLALMDSAPVESNSVIDKFNGIRPGTALNALHSQGLLQLKKEYCEQNKCLKCAFGIKFLQEQEHF